MCSSMNAPTRDRSSSGRPDRTTITSAPAAAMWSASVRPVSMRFVCVQHIALQHAEGCTAPNVLCCKPCVLFATQRHDRDVTAERFAVFTKSCQAGQARQHAREPVVVAAVGNQIKVGADDQCRCCSVGIRQRHREIERRIDFDLQFELACRLRNHIVSQLLPLAIGSPGNSDTVESPLADFREQIACQPQTEVETCLTCGLRSGHRFTIWFAERDTNQ